MVGENGKEDYTEDGTVDLKGRPVLRSNTGRWRACSFIVGSEVIERLTYFGISSNLVLYLTKKLHQGTVKSANNVTDWAGTVTILPVIGAYIADAYLGRYWTFVVSSGIYFLGMCLLTLSVSLPTLRPPPCAVGIEKQDCQKASSLQIGIFFFALYIIAAGTGGLKPSITTLGADQFDEFDPKEKSQKLSFYNWWVFYIIIGAILAETVLVYIQDNVGFALGYGIPTILLVFSTLVFLFGTPIYRHKLPSGSPLTRMVQVFVSALRKWKLNVPNDKKVLHEVTIEEYTSNGRYRINHSSSLSFLDKAAVKTDQTSPWMLCTVTQIEETKQMIKMIPILIATCIPSIIVAQTNTLFVKQGVGTKNPILYLDFPQGRMKLFGTILYPKNRYLTLQFSKGGKSVMCEDYFDNMIVFSDAWWIGTKDENPEEAKLEFPKELYEGKQTEHDFKGGAGAGAASVVNHGVSKTKIKRPEPESPETPLEEDLSDSEIELKDKTELVPVRQSARTVKKSYKVAEISSGDDSGKSSPDLSEHEEKAVEVDTDANDHTSSKKETAVIDIDDEDDAPKDQLPMENKEHASVSKAKKGLLVQATISSLFKKVEVKKAAANPKKSPSSKASGQKSQPAGSKRKIELDEGPKKRARKTKDKNPGEKKKAKSKDSEVEDDDDIEEFSNASEDSDEDWAA